METKEEIRRYEKLTMDVIGHIQPGRDGAAKIKGLDCFIKRAKEYNDAGPKHLKVWRRYRSNSSVAKRFHHSLWLAKKKAPSCTAKYLPKKFFFDNVFDFLEPNNWKIELK